MSFFGFGKKKEEKRPSDPPPPSMGPRQGGYQSGPPPRAAPSADLDYQRQQLFSGASAQGRGSAAQYSPDGEETVESLQQRTLQVQGETTQSSMRSLQNIHRIQDMGMSAMSMLDKNQQQLDRIEGRLGDAFDQSHKASIHTRDLEKLNRPFFVPVGKLAGDSLQDTTFRGSSRHGFLDDSADAKKKAADEKRRAKLAALNGEVVESRARQQELLQPGPYQGDGSFESRSQYESQAQNQHLDAIAQALPGIRQMALGIGETIDSQNAQIGRLTQAATSTSGKVAASGRRLDRIIGKGSQPDPTESMQASAGQYMFSQAFK